jgi:DNA-binding XRE family transcriptional regulator
MALRNVSILKYGFFDKMNPDDPGNQEPPQEPTLKNLIEAAGTTQRQICKDIGIAEVTINTWVAGKKVPRFDNAIALARELRVSLKTLAKAMRLDVSDIPDDDP